MTIESPTNQVALHNAIEQFLAADLVYACLLLVHPEIKQLEAAGTHVERHYGWPRLVVGELLGQELGSVTPRRRPRQVGPVLVKAMAAYLPGPVLCTDIDLLCHPLLELDPIAILRQLSRQVPLIVTWPGTVEQGTLSYATPGHDHYRTWPRAELCEQCVLEL